MPVEEEFGGTKATRTRGPDRPYPRCALEDALVVAKAIRERNGGRPFNRLLLAEAIGKSPGSSGFRDLVASSAKYELTTGNFQSPVIQLTPRGEAAVAPRTKDEEATALIEAALAPEVFGRFYRVYDQKKMTDDRLACNVLERELGVPHELTAECLDMIRRNGLFVGIIREIAGSPYVTLSASGKTRDAATADRDESPGLPAVAKPMSESQVERATRPEPPRGRQIFIGHGKERGPVEKIEKVLKQFGIACSVAVEEPNKGRPISEKVADTMRECSAAVLVFTRDEELRDLNGNVVWRPSENVIFELGAASVLYGQRIVIFKEQGIDFPSNFRDLGHIPFERDKFEASGLELIKELVGLGLLRVTVE